MSIEDLSTGFVSLEKVVTRDETFASDLAGAVQDNADLLNLLVTRVNALEAATVLSSEGFQKASDFTTEGLQKASDFTTEGLQKASDFTTELDTKLRAHLDEAILAMKVDFDRLEAKAQAAQPSVDFGKMGKAFDDLQGQLTAMSTRLSESFEFCRRSRPQPSRVSSPLRSRATWCTRSRYRTSQATRCHCVSSTTRAQHTCVSSRGRGKTYVIYSPAYAPMP